MLCSPTYRIEMWALVLSYLTFNVSLLKLSSTLVDSKMLSVNSFVFHFFGNHPETSIYTLALLPCYVCFENGIVEKR